MEKKKMNIIAGIFALVFMASFIIYTNIEGPKETKKEYEKFNTANINGILDEDANGSVGGAHISVNAEKFTFLPYTPNMNVKPIFEKIAKKGDSIIKPPYADMLTLKKKDGTIYKYTFSKFE